MDDDFVDLYALLGVEPDVDKSALRKAFLNKSRKLHPDKNPSPDAADMFDAVKVAYETLSDPASKAKFDTERAAKMHQQERFRKMDAAKQEAKTSLAERERFADQQTRKAVQRQKSQLLARLKAENLAKVEEVRDRMAASRMRRMQAAAGDGGGGGTGGGAGAGAGAGAGGGVGVGVDARGRAAAAARIPEAPVDYAATLESKEADTFALMEAAMKRRGGS